MIAKDKLYHLTAGLVIGLSAILIGWCALLLVALAGVGKEVYDQWKYGGFDWVEALFTLYGGVLSVLLIQLAKGVNL